MALEAGLPFLPGPANINNYSPPPLNESALGSALVFMTLIPSLNHTVKASARKSIPELLYAADPKYSVVNWNNLRDYFDSLGKDGHPKDVTIDPELSPDHPDNNEVLVAGFQSNHDRDMTNMDHEGGSGGRKRRTTRRPRPTRTTRFVRPSRPSRRTTTTTPFPTTTESGQSLNPVDSTWILLCAMIIFTMQTGFGLLEGGIVSQKNQTNIMMKNVADVVFGGFSYWIFGYGISYGTWPGSVSWFGFGFYFVDASYPKMGDIFTSFFFQLSFATTATTIVSGAMAERVNFKSYCLYSLLATITYCVQARWVWGPGGFLAELGALDVAGSGCVHLVGGASAFVAAWMLGPRLGRYDMGSGTPPMGNPSKALVGLFFLWWGWVAFNAGSTYGMTEEKWQFAARAASTTMIASIGGGIVGMIWGFLKGWRLGKIFEVADIINPILGALVSITAGCALMHMVEAFFTGFIGAIVVLLAGYLPDMLKIDDPVGATAVHGFGGIWGLLAVGVFAEDDYAVLGLTKGRYGLTRAGGWYLLGVQTLSAVCIATWSMVSTFIILLAINIIFPLRVSPQDELLGLDFSEHGIRRAKIGTSPALSLFGSSHEVNEIQRHQTGITGGDNPGHEKITEVLRDVRPRTKRRRRVIAKKSFKSAALFVRAFKKLQSKGNRITPREREYIFDEYSSPLKSSTESLNCTPSGRKKHVRVQTDPREFEKLKKKQAREAEPGKASLWSRVNPFYGWKHPPKKSENDTSSLDSPCKELTPRGRRGEPREDTKILKRMHQDPAPPDESKKVVDESNKNVKDEFLYMP